MHPPIAKDVIAKLDELKHNFKTLEPDLADAAGQIIWASLNHISNFMNGNYEGLMNEPVEFGDLDVIEGEIVDTEETKATPVHYYDEYNEVKPNQIDAIQKNLKQLLAIVFDYPEVLSNDQEPELMIFKVDALCEMRKNTGVLLSALKSYAHDKEREERMARGDNSSPADNYNEVLGDPEYVPKALRFAAHAETSRCSEPTLNPPEPEPKLRRISGEDWYKFFGKNPAEEVEIEVEAEEGSILHKVLLGREKKK